jgi:HEAT repeat protein
VQPDAEADSGIRLADAVRTLLENPDAPSRERAARAIGPLVVSGGDLGPGLGDSGETEKDHHHALVIGLSDPATAVRIAAACALASVGDERALEYLGIRSRNSEPEALRQAAAWAIERIAARSQGEQAL